MGNWWHFKNWFRVGNRISWKLNFYTLTGYLYFFKPFHHEFFYRQAEKKHAFIIKSLEHDFASIIDKYRNVPEPEAYIPNETIWTLWWQGVEAAPPLVKACIRQMQEQGRKVIIITKDNYSEYVTVPEYILDKQRKGYMSLAHLSDVIRYTLLTMYGGLWLDSTIFIAGPIPERAFKDRLFTLHTRYAKNPYVQHNLYHIFVFGTCRKEKLVSFITEMFHAYWKEKDTIIDYLMLDYLVMLAYRNFPDIRNEIDSLTYTSERLYDLVGMLNKPYQEEEFGKLKAECTFSKLNWHPKYKTEVKGIPTYYQKLIENVE